MELEAERILPVGVRGACKRWAFARLAVSAASDIVFLAGVLPDGSSRLMLFTSRLEFSTRKEYRVGEGGLGGRRERVHYFEEVGAENNLKILVSNKVLIAGTGGSCGDENVR